MADEKYTRCPDCARKSVYFRAMRNGEDNYQCRHKNCDFFFFTLSGAKADRDNEARWQQANAGVPVVQPQQEKNVELPDAIRVPLDELEADAAYIIGRVAVDGSCSGIMVEAIRKRTRAIREALLAHGAQGSSARDHNEVMALVYLYGSHCAEHPEDAAGQQERLAGVKTALGVTVVRHQTKDKDHQ